MPNADCMRYHDKRHARKRSSFISSGNPRPRDTRRHTLCSSRDVAHNYVTSAIAAKGVANTAAMRSITPQSLFMMPCEPSFAWRNIHWASAPVYRFRPEPSVRLVTLAARFSPTDLSVDSGWRTIVRRDPPISAFAPKPGPNAILPLTPT